MRASTMTFAGNSSSLRKSCNNTSGTVAGIEKVDSSNAAEGLRAANPASGNPSSGNLGSGILSSTANEDGLCLAANKGLNQRLLRGSGVTITTETPVIQDEDEDSSPFDRATQVAK